MTDHDRSTETVPRRVPVDQLRAESAHRAMSVRATEWASDRVLDPGDSHDKGEQSLCVGEAA
jgi:hypothetical protein